MKRCCKRCCKKRQKVILALSLVLILMTVGYAAFAASLKITGLANITSKFKILITNVESTNNGTGASNAENSPTYTDDSATFNVLLNSPGDEMLFNVTIENQGNIDGVLNKIKKIESDNPAIKVTISGVQEGDTLNAGETAIMKVRIKYDESVESQPDSLTSNVRIELLFNQDGIGDGGIVEPDSDTNFSKNYDEIVCDGTNIENTKIYLFSKENIDKNFDISFELKEINEPYASQGTIVNSMKEVSPYPGYVFRLTAATDQLEFNSPSIANKRISISTTKKVLIRRQNDIYFLIINDDRVYELGTDSLNQTIDIPLTFCASLDEDKQPWRFFTGTLSNVKIEVTKPESYTVVFEPNGAEGTMADQVIRKDEKISLKEVEYTKDGYLFAGWNTKADGTGKFYDNKEIVTNIAQPGEAITLYATWLTPFNYSITYNSNGGEGTMTPQTLTYGTSQAIKSNTFTKGDRTFIKWNTKADGTGTDYTENQVVKNLTRTENDNIILYAIWAKEYYYKDTQTFDGSNCIYDTNVRPYSSANKNSDYEISLDIDNSGTNEKQATLMSVMEEVKPWPGVLFRTISATQYEFDMNGGNKSYKETVEIKNVKKVKYERKDGKIYISYTNMEPKEVVNHSTIKSFDVPVSFGCSLDKDLSPQRYFVGTLKNMKAIVYE